MSKMYSKKQVIDIMNYYGNVRYAQGKNDETLSPSEDVEVIEETSKLVVEALNNFNKFVPPEIKKEFNDYLPEGQ